MLDNIVRWLNAWLLRHVLELFGRHARHWRRKREWNGGTSRRYPERRSGSASRSRKWWLSRRFPSWKSSS